MGIDPAAMPGFRLLVQVRPDAAFRYIDGIFDGFRGQYGLGLYRDWERIFVENGDPALLTRFYGNYQHLFPAASPLRVHPLGFYY